MGWIGHGGVRAVRARPETDGGPGIAADGFAGLYERAGTRIAWCPWWPRRGCGRNSRGRMDTPDAPAVQHVAFLPGQPGQRPRELRPHPLRGHHGHHAILVPARS